MIRRVCSLRSSKVSNNSEIRGKLMPRGERKSNNYTDPLGGVHSLGGPAVGFEKSKGFLLHHMFCFNCFHMVVKIAR